MDFFTAINVVKTHFYFPFYMGLLNQLLSLLSCLVWLWTFETDVSAQISSLFNAWKFL